MAKNRCKSFGDKGLYQICIANLVPKKFGMIFAVPPSKPRAEKFGMIFAVPPSKPRAEKVWHDICTSKPRAENAEYFQFFWHDICSANLTKMQEKISLVFSSWVRIMPI